MADQELKVGPAEVSGNGAVLAVRSSGRAWVVEFMSEPRTSPEPLWFHLECKDAGGRPIRFVWRNADGCLGLGGAESLRNVRPVVRLDGGPWQRLGSVRLRRRPSGGHVLTFATPAPCDRAAAAFCYPYGPADLERTRERIADTWEAEPIGLSGKGRPLTRLRAIAAVKGEPPGVYVLARQHAGETPGSWVLDGLLRAVASKRRGGNPLRRVEWWAVPFVDLDGVVEGNYGKDALPIDFNRAWNPMPLRPEVLAIQRDMRRFVGRVGPRLVIDLHAPGGGEKQFYMFLCRDERPARQRAMGESLAECLANEFKEMPRKDLVKRNGAPTPQHAKGEALPDGRPDESREVPREALVRVPRYPSRWDANHVLTGWAWDHLDETAGVTFETAYQAIEEGAWLEPRGYRQIGRRIARIALAWLSKQ